MQCLAQASKDTAGKVGEGQLHLSQALGKVVVPGAKSTEGLTSPGQAPEPPLG